MASGEVCEQIRGRSSPRGAVAAIRKPHLASSRIPPAQGGPLPLRQRPRRALQMEAAFLPMAQKAIDQAVGVLRRLGCIPPVPLPPGSLGVSEDFEVLFQLLAECSLQTASSNAVLFEVFCVHEGSTFGECMPWVCSHYHVRKPCLELAGAGRGCTFVPGESFP
eukprot:6321908-Amphidinium_carterae.2